MSKPIDFFFDPVCPFCWVTSKWIRQVSRLQSDLVVEWQPISLAILNEGTDRAGNPGHLLGLELLRVANAVDEGEGNEAVGRYYQALGEAIWEKAPTGVVGRVAPEDRPRARWAHQRAVTSDLTAVLESAGIPGTYSGTRRDEVRDAALRQSTAEAIRRTGPGVGTPVISFDPPDGPAFFGPVISQLADDREAVALWKALETLARYPSFAEIKRSLRQTPQTLLHQSLAGS